MHDSSDGRDDLDPVSFHFCNVIGHAVVTCLVYFLAVRLCSIRNSLAQAAKTASPAAQKQLQAEGAVSDGSDRQAALAHCMQHLRHSSPRQNSRGPAQQHRVPLHASSMTS